MNYEHTQSAPQLVLVLLAFAIGHVALAVIIGEPLVLLASGVLVMVATILHAFSALTTTVTPAHIIVAFRWGRPRREIPVAAVLGAEIVRNSWWYGWGLRWIPGATMFNVWGLDAVHLELDGPRGFRIGTDDPEGLAAAIRAGAARG